jgi:multicomponent Na+:H+ antiporter subunit C
MEVLYSLLTGGLFGISVYFLLQSNTLLMLFGIMILGSAVNLLIFVIGRLDYAVPAFVNEETMNDVSHFASPLPQALILTAIVISFALIAYLLVLIRNLWQDKKTLNILESLDEV